MGLFGRLFGKKRKRRASSDPVRSRVWGVWSYGYDGEPMFVEAYRDKGEAQRKIARLRRSHPGVHYEIRRSKLPAKRTFGTRAHTRTRARSVTRSDPKRKRELSLDEAASYARQHRLIGDYYSLSDDVTSELHRLMNRTRWRQSRGSLASGHSQVYAFHQAIKRHTQSGSSRSASGDYAARYRGPKHVYASPEVKRTASYKRAERLERELAPRAWETPGLSRKDLERVADAWERAGFLGWADNYRAHARRAGSGRDPARRHRRPGAPTFAQQKRISRKIRLLRREGYGAAQSAAIAYRMEGVSRPARRTRRRR